ncbi:hypothetical protein B5M47_02985 [candidate division CPR3 bacterium 4484_211]|uniref:Uncharacterized protein n=1 Tax=candidate division CPR3 bacterium 4484_211 TaxID=1968527 RepID=A0A1W9NXA3_UNCC3|nr:MAG: hypothetical protein B5M47_02985 [candidate division CPR3 bacterium 4484_211]
MPHHINSPRPDVKSGLASIPCPKVTERDYREEPALFNRARQMLAKFPTSPPNVINCLNSLFLALMFYSFVKVLLKTNRSLESGSRPPTELPLGRFL